MRIEIGQKGSGLLIDMLFSIIVKVLEDKLMFLGSLIEWPTWPMNERSPMLDWSKKDKKQFFLKQIHKISNKMKSLLVFNLHLSHYSGLLAISHVLRKPNYRSPSIAWLMKTFIRIIKSQEFQGHSYFARIWWNSMGKKALNNKNYHTFCFRIILLQFPKKKRPQNDTDHCILVDSSSHHTIKFHMQRTKANIKCNANASRSANTHTHITKRRQRECKWDIFFIMQLNSNCMIITMIKCDFDLNKLDFSSECDGQKFNKLNTKKQKCAHFRGNKVEWHLIDKFFFF